MIQFLSIYLGIGFVIYIASYLGFRRSIWSDPIHLIPFILGAGFFAIIWPMIVVFSLSDDRHG